MASPILEELLISLVLSFFIALGYRFLTNPREMKRVKEEVSFYRQKIRTAQKEGKMDEAMKLNQDALQAQMKMMKFTMRPMALSLGIFIVGVYGIMLPLYSGTVILQLPFAFPLFTSTELFGFLPFVTITIRESIGWVWWYILITAPTIHTFRKLLGAE